MNRSMIISTEDIMDFLLYLVFLSLSVEERTLLLDNKRYYLC